MPKRLENIIGIKSEKLEIISEAASKKVPAGKRIVSQRWVNCKCDCGKIISCPLIHITRKSNPRKSCGCKKSNGEIIKHGYSGTSTHNIWKAMKQRCNNPNTDYYYCYGGKGITYDKSWEKFENFLKDMGEAPKGYSIERLDINKNYCKSNCKWIPLNNQGYNTSTTKLDWDKIKEIREYYKSCTTKKQCADYFADKYSLDFRYVYKIINNKVWVK